MTHDLAVRRLVLLAACALLMPASVALAAKGHASQNPIEGLERARVVVVGNFESVSPLALGAYLGVLSVEEVLVGGTAEDGTAEVVWEASGLSVPSRHAAGDRVLVGLDALPTASIWRQRVPDDAARAGLLSLASGGRAVLERPSTTTQTLIRHYLALSPAARAGDAGLTRLAQLAAKAELEAARPALDRLIARVGPAGDSIPDSCAEQLVAVLLRTDDPELAPRLIDWIEIARPAALARPLDRVVARRPDSAPPRTIEAARAALRGELETDRVYELSRSADATDRMLAVQHVRGDAATRLLPGLAAADPSERVRAAAIERWGAVGGSNALPELLRALDDPAVSVRRSAAHATARIGEPALDAVVDVAETGPPDAAQFAIVSLSLMGEPARPALVALSAEHPDEGIRTLARIALGVPIGHEH